MKTVLALILLTLTTLSYAQTNSYPIILLHGFVGWDRQEMAGFHYWGGYDDIQESLKERGFDVRTASVGPVSSNWDRACELYAYIKGGTVDYGIAHAKEHHHARFGRTFKGIYPEWSEKNKIHLVGHSMGGLTSRLLIHLLENGIDNQGESPLFMGDKKWVHSLTTLSTPHNGTTLVEGVEMYLPLIQATAVLFSKTQGGNTDYVYDLKLDQWSLKRFDDESSAEYAERLFSLMTSLNRLKDFSKYDLSREGTQELNSWVKDSPNVFYQSWATEATSSGIFSDTHSPSLTMTPLLFLAAEHMGRYGDNKRWYQNDGIVNTISMAGPSTSLIEPYRGSLYKGRWVFRGTKALSDHFDIIGILNLDPFSGFDDELMDWHQDLFSELVEIES